MFGHTKGNPLLANDVSFQILFVRLRSEHIQAVGKPVKIILGAIMAYSFRISSSLTAGTGRTNTPHHPTRTGPSADTWYMDKQTTERQRFK